MLKDKLKNYIAKHEDGFTVIEVIIVLVIGAVIMLAVFLVVPQVQRQQRNNRRQADARRVLAAAEQVAANTGSYPACSGTYIVSNTSCKSLVDITGELKTTTGSSYSIVSTLGSTAYLTEIAMALLPTATCTSGKLAATSGGTNFVVSVREDLGISSNSSQNWCVSN